MHKVHIINSEIKKIGCFFQHPIFYVKSQFASQSMMNF